MKLQALISQYIKYRKSLGEKFDTSARHLKHFCRIMGKNAAISMIPSKQIISFLHGKKQITTNFFDKHSTLKGFYNYCISRGYTRHYPLPMVLPKKPAPLEPPYIYSHDELKRFFATTLVYQKVLLGNHVTPYTVYVFFILLYGTGLRVSEAISLTMADVDLLQAILTIKNTKFYKTRLVPFNKDLLKLLNEYSSHRKNNKHSQQSHAPFFISKKGKFLTYQTIGDIFERVCKQAGIERTNHRPRIHDFRHTFAVHRIISWYQVNADVQSLLPLLSVYMGHTKLSSTSVYLTMTPELLCAANKRFEKYTKGGVL